MDYLGNTGVRPLLDMEKEEGDLAQSQQRIFYIGKGKRSRPYSHLYKH